MCVVVCGEDITHNIAALVIPSLCVHVNLYMWPVMFTWTPARKAIAMFSRSDNLG